MLKESYKIEMDNMKDEDLVSVWKIYKSKMNKFKKDSKEYRECVAIANYAMGLHVKIQKEAQKAI